MEKKLDPEQYVKDLEAHITRQQDLLIRYSRVLENLLINVEESMKTRRRTYDLTDTVREAKELVNKKRISVLSDDANDLLYGADRNYVDQG
tara:strand:+ start:350 stop:622 length:273 start_codon:yes stop_codon:yes gene_type:complete